MDRLARSIPLLALVVVAGCSAPHQAPTDRVSTSGDAIINGTESPAAQDAVVLIDFPAGRCSGSLVAKNLVLTARHCVGKVDDSDNSVVNFKATDLGIFTGQKAPQKANARSAPAARGKKLFTTGTNMIPDVALIVLDKAIEAPVAPIRLEGGAKVSEPLTIVGYGINENSEAPDVRMQRTGKTVTRVFPQAMPSGWNPLDPGEFTFSEAACSGDSGGPALGGDTGAVIGVASRVGNGTNPDPADRAAFCRGSSTLNIYTSLDPVKDMVMEAFSAAGAKPVLEGATAEEEPAPTDETEPPPETTKPPAPTEQEEPATEEDPKPTTEDAAPEEETPTRRPRPPKSSTKADPEEEEDDGTSSAAASTNTKHDMQSAGCSMGARKAGNGATWGIVLGALALAAGRRRRARRA